MPEYVKEMKTCQKYTGYINSNYDRHTFRDEKHIVILKEYHMNINSSV